ncbi:hypothetical protein POM88_014850 [Heracleum sosnowskyi]|uniref:Uncharacterized protein n=1 Tax=Heracleum sosnowskyi TaxID=360622 RepID=A0AAD8MVT0_9APIA|nr:hypothetical protein POM88_014850 [Heracleum sosnowskyi]
MHIRLSSDVSIGYQIYARYSRLSSLDNWDYYKKMQQAAVVPCNLRSMNQLRCSSPHGSCQIVMDSNGLTLISYCHCDNDRGGFDDSFENVSHQVAHIAIIFPYCIQYRSCASAYWALRQRNARNSDSSNKDPMLEVYLAIEREPILGGGAMEDNRLTAASSSIARVGAKIRQLKGRFKREAQFWRMHSMEGGQENCSHLFNRLEDGNLFQRSFLLIYCHCDNDRGGFDDGFENVSRQGRPRELLLFV